MYVIYYYTHSIWLFNLFRYLKVNHYKNIIKINNALNLNIFKDKKSVIKISKNCWSYADKKSIAFSSCQYCCLMHFIYTAEFII